MTTSSTPARPSCRISKYISTNNIDHKDDRQRMVNADPTTRDIQGAVCRPSNYRHDCTQRAWAQVRATVSWQTPETTHGGAPEPWRPLPVSLINGQLQNVDYLPGQLFAIFDRPGISRRRAVSLALIYRYFLYPTSGPSCASNIPPSDAPALASVPGSVAPMPEL